MTKKDAIEPVNTTEIVETGAIDLAPVPKLHLRQLVEDVYGESMEAIHGTMLFGEIEVTSRCPETGALTFAPMPSHWKDRFGSMEKAKKFYALACAGWLNKSEAPNAMDVAVKIATTVLKVEAVKSQSARTLNVENISIQVESPHVQYPENVIEEEETF